MTEVRGFITNRRHCPDAVLGATRLAPMGRTLRGCHQAEDDGDGREVGWERPLLTPSRSQASEPVD